MWAQGDETPEAQLLGKAQTLASRGRLELAKATWQQVLQMDAANAEALAGLARVAREERQPGEASGYIEKLRGLSPQDPRLAELQAEGPARNSTVLVVQAVALQRAGQAVRAMVLYRQAYGERPPLGAPALMYFETEAETIVGLPRAVAALRALADRYPGDSRYAIELGRVLTYNARSRAEGLKLLDRYAYCAEARAATEQAVLWEHASRGVPALASNELAAGNESQVLNGGSAQEEMVSAR